MNVTWPSFDFMDDLESLLIPSTLNRKQRRRAEALARTGRIETLILNAYERDPEATDRAFRPRQARDKADGLREHRDTWWLMDAVDAGLDLRSAAEAGGVIYPFQMPASLYPNHLSLLADRGREWTSADVTMYDGPQLPDRACYENALLAAVHLGLKYAEGLSLSRISPEPGKPKVNVVTWHAFAYDPSTGGVVEAMYEEPADSYLGIVFEVEQVTGALEATGVHGIFGNDDLNGYDLLRRGILGLDWTLKGGERSWDQVED